MTQGGNSARLTAHIATATGSLEPDADGFYWPACECGEQVGPFPDLETAIDALMEHAFDAGRRA